MDGVVLFFSIVFCAAGITTLLFGLYERRKVIHVHVHKYKMSQDFARLWDLIHDGNRIVYLDPDDNSTFRWGGLIWVRYWHDNTKTIYGLGLSSREQDNLTKEKFIGLCQFKGISFFDFADEVKE